MSIVRGNNGHIFSRSRPSAGGTYPIHREPPRDTHVRPLPDPEGQAPYHLDLRDVIAAGDYQKILDTRRLIFHVDGDMGGIKDAMPQELVAKGLEQDLEKAADDGSLPQFMYITGDCVYFNGEISQYYAQFYEPYELYPRPIFAVPGADSGPLWMVIPAEPGRSFRLVMDALSSGHGRRKVGEAIFRRHGRVSSAADAIPVTRIDRKLLDVARRAACAGIRPSG